MKAIVLSRKHRSEIINIISNWHSHEDYIRVENAIGWLTHGSKEVNPFEVFGPQEKELIIEALEHTASAYRRDGDPGNWSAPSNLKRQRDRPVRLAQKKQLPVKNRYFGPEQPSIAAAELTKESCHFRGL